MTEGNLARDTEQPAGPLFAGLAGSLEGDPDHRAALEDAIRHGLARCGLTAPEVAIRAVTLIERHPETGKVLRFLPCRTRTPDRKLVR